MNTDAKWMFFFEPITPRIEAKEALTYDEDNFWNPCFASNSWVFVEQDPIKISDADKEVKSENQKEEISLYEPSSPSHSRKSKGSSRRRDVENKASIRLIRRFYRDLFKSHNKSIVRRRYTNCKIKQIYYNMYKTLENKIPEELLTEDLVYFTIGILTLKESSKLRCTKEVKEDITDFLNCVRNYTKIRYLSILKSPKVKTLWKYIIEALPEDPNAKLLSQQIQD